MESNQNQKIDFSGYLNNNGVGSINTAGNPKNGRKRKIQIVIVVGCIIFLVIFWGKFLYDNRAVQPALGPTNEFIPK